MEILIKLFEIFVYAVGVFTVVGLIFSFYCVATGEDWNTIRRGYSKWNNTE